MHYQNPYILNNCKICSLENLLINFFGAVILVTTLFNCLFQNKFLFVIKIIVREEILIQILISFHVLHYTFYWILCLRQRFFQLFFLFPPVVASLFLSSCDVLLQQNLVAHVLSLRSSFLVKLDIDDKQMSSLVVQIYSFQKMVKPEP